MNELNNKEDLTHYNEIIAEFDSINMPAKQRKAIMTAIQALITEQVRLEMPVVCDMSTTSLEDRFRRLVVELTELAATSNDTQRVLSKQRQVLTLATNLAREARMDEIKQLGLAGQYEKLYTVEKVQAYFNKRLAQLKKEEV